MVDLSIIIVSYKVKDYLHDCLASIYKHTQGLTFEVIVVDNDSSDGTAETVEQSFPQVKLFRQPNLGFGVANNFAAKKATGKYLLLLNPDTLIFNNTFQLSLEQARSLPKLGAYTCRLLYQDKTIQPSGGYFPTLGRIFAWQLFFDDLPLLNWLIKPIHPPASFYTHSFSPDWIMGAFMLIPKEVFDKVGGFDEKIFMYGEELELCYRLKKAGLLIYYSAHPSIIHLQGKSSSSHYALVKEVAGLKYFAAKHLPRTHLPWVNLAFKLGSLLRLLLFGIILGNDAKRATYWEIFRS